MTPSPELAPAPAPAPEFSITAARSPPSKKPGLAALAGGVGGGGLNATAAQPGVALAAAVGDGGVAGSNTTKPAAAAASSQQPTIATTSPSPAVNPAAAALGNATKPAVAAADVGASPPAPPPSPIGEACGTAWFTSSAACAAYLGVCVCAACALGTCRVRAVVSTPLALFHRACCRCHCCHPQSRARRHLCPARCRRPPPALSLRPALNLCRAPAQHPRPRPRRRRRPPTMPRLWRCWLSKPA